MNSGNLSGPHQHFFFFSSQSSPKCLLSESYISQVCWCSLKPVCLIFILQIFLIFRRVFTSRNFIVLQPVTNLIEAFYQNSFNCSSYSRFTKMKLKKLSLSLSLFLSLSLTDRISSFYSNRSLLRSNYVYLVPSCNLDFSVQDKSQVFIELRLNLFFAIFKVSHI